MEGNESESSSHPLFSAIVALFSLILLYLPQILPTIVFSPVVIITLPISLTLLRLIASRRNQIGSSENAAETEECESVDGDRESITNETDFDPELESGFDPDFDPELESGFDPDFDPELELGFEESFVEWNVGAPLEVIYEEDDDEDPSEDMDPRSVAGHPTLSLYYSDSDSSSEGGWDSPESMRFRWEEELIEIDLEGKKRDCEEENLIEIDISFPASKADFPARD